MQYTASLPGASGQGNSCSALPHCLWAVGSAIPAIHGLIAWGDGEFCPGGGCRRKMELLQCTATLLGGSEQCNSCNTLPHRLGVVGSGTRAMRWPSSWEDGESCPGGGRCLKSACGGWQPPSARAHQPGGRGVLPRTWSPPKDCLRGIAAPIGAGPPAGRMGSPAQEAVAAWGDGESCPGGGRCLRSACGGWQPSEARAHLLGGWGVLPGRRSLPKERLRGMAAPIGVGPQAGGELPSPTGALWAATASWAGLPIPPAGGPAPMGAAIPHRHFLGSDRLLGKTPHPPSWWARAYGPRKETTTRRNGTQGGGGGCKRLIAFQIFRETYLTKSSGFREISRTLAADTVDSGIVAASWQHVRPFRRTVSTLLPSLTHSHTPHTRSGPAASPKPRYGGLHAAGCQTGGRERGTGAREGDDRECRGTGGAHGRRQAAGGRSARGRRVPELCRGPCVRGGRTGGEEGEAGSAVLTRGR